MESAFGKSLPKLLINPFLNPSPFHPCPTSEIRIPPPTLHTLPYQFLGIFLNVVLPPTDRPKILKHDRPNNTPMPGHQTWVPTHVPFLSGALHVADLSTGPGTRLLGPRRDEIGGSRCGVGVGCMDLTRRYPWSSHFT
jgi:hypothetical protein